MNNTIKLTLLLILMCSCQKIQNDGGLLSRDVYILENGKLVDAQNYEKTIPQEGGIFNIEFVTFGITNIENKKRADGIVMTTDVSPVPDEDDLYDIVMRIQNGLENGTVRQLLLLLNLTAAKRE